MNLRDFIYLDWERVRALAAQLDDHDSGDGDLFERPDDETPTATAQLASGAHDASLAHQQEIATSLENNLRSSGKLLEIDQDFNFETDWADTAFTDGRPVVCTGLLRVIDYESTSQFLAAAPELMKVAFHMANWSAQRSSLSYAGKKQLEEQRTEQQKQISELKALRLDQFGVFIKEIFGSGVRMKMIPNLSFPGHLLVGIGPRNCFLTPPAALIEQYGFQIDAGWKVFGQLNRSATDVPVMAMTTGNNILDNFETMAIQVNSIFQIQKPPQPPALSFVPLTVYRTV